MIQLVQLLPLKPCLLSSQSVACLSLEGAVINIWFILDFSRSFWRCSIVKEPLNLKCSQQLKCHRNQCNYACYLDKCMYVCVYIYARKEYSRKQMNIIKFIFVSLYIAITGILNMTAPHISLFIKPDINIYIYSGKLYRISILRYSTISQYNLLPLAC